MALALVIAALILCVLAAIPKVQGAVTVSLGWLGMACYFLSLLIGRV